MIKFENEKATIAYADYVACLNAENTPSDIQEPLLLGYIEALHQFDLITEQEYNTLVNLWYPE
jgi:hypothetical protein